MQKGFKKNLLNIDVSFVAIFSFSSKSKLLVNLKQGKKL